MKHNPFTGTIPALMTPCKPDRTPDFDALVRKAKELVGLGMSGVIYAGSMGDWPLLTDAERMEGTERLIDAGIPVIVGTGAINTKSAVALAAHGARVGAKGLMVIPRVLSRGASATAQRHHFKAILAAAPDLPAVIYNSPVYGFATRADLFFALRAEHPNLVGFKEFGGNDALTYASEHITSGDPDLTLMVGVDTSAYHGFVHAGATGCITGIGNCLPREVLHLVSLCEKAQKGDVVARQKARELDEAMTILALWDAGTDLVLYYKYLMVLNGDAEYALHFNETDELTPAQRGHAEDTLNRFRTWYAAWSKTA
ncbi:MAG: dihydrodipicolinate synthase family protein [Rubellimicrobium sp.]|nr:dihydrodipicolinate synthase family protein [Rubellimicrobium sp.]